MSGPGQPDVPGDGVHLEATAYGQGDVHQAGRDLHIHHGEGVRRVPEPRDGAGAVCPYPGLAAFTRDQAGWFFGRDGLTADLLRRLDAATSRGGPVMVVAASGAGKSSLLQAGLLHQLANGALPAEGSRDWPRVVIVPGAHPIREAAAALAAALPATAMQRLPQGSGAEYLDTMLLSLAQTAVLPGRPAARVVLVVDQFEELFTLCESEAERGEFVSWLWRAADGRRAGGPMALVTCGLRADFYAQCVTGHAELRRSLQTDQLVVGPMSEDELRQAIVLPAQAAGLEIEPGLADLLLAELRAGNNHLLARDGLGAADYDAGRLPLLAHALRATWQQRHGCILTVDGYRATGGIDHAIAETADSVFNRLDDTGQSKAKLMFLRLVKIGDAASGDVRRPVTRPDLATGAPVEAVLDAFIGSRLLTSTRDAVQITHEALLSAWPKLKGWLDEDRAGHLTRQKIEDTAADWERRRDPSLLYRGASLEAAGSWASTHPGELTSAAGGFLAASRQLARRSAVIRRSAVAVLTALTLIAAAAAGIALWQRGVASQQRDQAIFNQVVAEAGQLQSTNQSLAAQLNLTAWRMDRTPSLTAQLLSTSTAALADPVPGPGGQVFSVAFSPDGHTLAGGSIDGKVQLWNAATPAHPVPIGQPLTGPANGIGSLAFSADGRTLAGGSGDGKVWLWNVTSPAHMARAGHSLAGPGGQVYSVAFSPDGRILAAGSADGAVSLWNVTSPARPVQIGQPVTGPAGAVWSVAFSPDGHTLAAGSADGKVWLWNTASPEHPALMGQPLTGPGGSVQSVAFSPDGRALAAGSLNGKVRLWNTATPARPAPIGQPLAGPASLIYSVAFSPDGHTLAAGSNDGKIWLWNVTSPAHPALIGQPLAGPAGAVYSVAFSPDGHTLAAGSFDGSIWSWNLPSTVLNGPAGGVESVTFSPGGRTMAAGSDDGKVRLWNTTSLSHPAMIGQPFAGPGGQVYSVAFSPDGRVLAAGSGNVVASSNNGKVRLWNVTSPAHPVRIESLDGLGGAITSVAFSPDGRTLAAGNIDGKIWLWNVTSPAHPALIGQIRTGPADQVYSVAFSPDGRTLAAGSGDEDVWMWNVASPGNPARIGQPLTGPGGPVQSVAFSPDGQTLAAGSDDDKVWLWNVTAPHHPVQIRQPLTGPASPVMSVAFSPDGHTLAAGSDDDVWLWNITSPAHPEQIGQPLTGPASMIGLVAFSPDGRALAAGANDDMSWLWNLNLSQVINRICSTSSGNLTPGRWSRYIPQLPYDPPCRRP